MNARFEWTEHHALCQRCDRVFRISTTAWEASERTEPDWSEDERLDAFEYCLSCILADDIPEEHAVQVGVLLGHDGNMAPEEDANGDPILLGWWYGTATIDGGEQVVTGPHRYAVDALRAAAAAQK